LTRWQRGFTRPQARAITPNDYFFMNSIGGPGTGPGTFGNNTNSGPYRIATDSQGNVYALDPFGTAQVQKFTPTGTFVCQIGGPSPSQGGLGLVFGMAVGADGVVYVLDTWRGDSNRVQEYSSADGGSTYTLSGHITTLGWRPARPSAWLWMATATST
jgi:hypothetical protein